MISRKMHVDFMVSVHLLFYPLSRDGGYSMAKDDLAEELRDLMQDAPDQQTKHEIKRIVDRLSQM